MGLCKCPKKKVTSLFCYEHRVNVCETCMVKHHSKCIVQSYLLWLQDSDYCPNCTLCGDKLVSDDCIRLLCLHVFHWKCLERKCRNLPNTSAPGAYVCPTCDLSIMPPVNVATPLADHLRDKFSEVNWGRRALGLPVLNEGECVLSEDNCSPVLNITNNALNSNRNGTKDDLVLYLDEPVYSRPEETAQMPRRILSNLGNTKLSCNDEDEKKNKKIYTGASLSRWLRYIVSRIKYLGRERYGKCKLVALGILTTLIICSVLSILGRRVTADDPAFNPLHNPHIHLKEPSS